MVVVFQVGTSNKGLAFANYQPNLTIFKVQTLKQPTTLFVCHFILFFLKFDFTVDIRSGSVEYFRYNRLVR